MPTLPRRQANGAPACGERSARTDVLGEHLAVKPDNHSGAFRFSAPTVSDKLPHYADFAIKLSRDLSALQYQRNAWA